MENFAIYGAVTVDVILAMILLTLAGLLLSSRDLFKAVVLFISFGLLMSLAWVRLKAIDIALAEAAIGAGLTGALFLSALGRMGQYRRKDRQQQKASRPFRDRDKK